jgi:DNA adenine methylase
MVQTRSDARPFLKWAGGKTQLVPSLGKLFPATFERYFEPFLGSGAVFFELRRSFGPFRAYLSDTNAELINAFTVVRDDPLALIKLLRKHKQRHHADFPEHYYTTRNKSTDTLTPVQRAARFIYLNKTCYNGLYRVNASGLFNVPVGTYKNPPICDEAGLHAASGALQRARLSTSDFDTALGRARAEDFVYFDPPYVPVSATANFTGYTSGGFDEQQQRRLASCFRELDRRGCFVMLSNSSSPLVEQLYRGYRTETVPARRAINSNGHRRGKVDEVVVLNY